MPHSIQSIATPRLVALPLSEAHFNEINRFHTDPHVMKTLSADGKPQFLWYNDYKALTTEVFC
jgi:hypothetical protein